MKKIFFFAAAAVLALTGCVKDEMYKGPSSIDKVVFTPEAPTSISDVTVTATVSGLQKVTEASLKYNGTSVPMSGSGSSFSATIPAQPDGTNVEFTVTVKNEAGFETVSDKFSYKVGDPATDWSKLKLNEVYGAGADEEKFFELYNAGDYPIKLTGVTISKDESTCWTGIDGEVVPAKGFFAIIGAKGTTDRGFSSGFSAKKSVLVELFDNKGNKIDQFQRGEKMDTGEWGASLSNNKGSWSRIPDGTGKWMITESFTPGAANSTAGTDDPDVKQ
ncbi:MAG: lamin tail domain-containing protein [Bacteroidales bacterium]|nr:lamin tail domain-containing protein [Bacteroidales bacterium]MBR1794198.1 lamin tail domain-containing protein [Bacteroidales bacterium]